MNSSLTTFALVGAVSLTAGLIGYGVTHSIIRITDKSSEWIAKSIYPIYDGRKDNEGDFFSPRFTDCKISITRYHQRHWLINLAALVSLVATGMIAAGLFGGALGGLIGLALTGKVVTIIPLYISSGCALGGGFWTLLKHPTILPFLDAYKNNH